MLYSPCLQWQRPYPSPSPNHQDQLPPLAAQKASSIDEATIIFDHHHLALRDYFSLRALHIAARDSFSYDYIQYILLFIIELYNHQAEEGGEY